MLFPSRNGKMGALPSFSENSSMSVQPSPPLCVGLIPARLAATRLPNKPLIEIGGKPMIQHVWERACRTPSLTRVAIATPDAEIAAAAHRFGAEVVMTSPNHRSGTDRLAEAATVLGLPPNAIVVNIQGDEPL